MNKLFFLSFLLMVPLLLFAQTPPLIKKIELTGQHAYTTKTIYHTLQLNVNTPFDSTKIELGIQNLLQQYRNDGYLQTQIEWSWQPPVLKVMINEGKRAVISEITLQGNNSIQDRRILKIMDTRPGKIFQEAVFLQDIDAILRLYENNGFPYCEIAPADFQLSAAGDSLLFALRIDENDLIKIKDIRIAGNTITRSRVIRRIMRIKMGEIYHQDKIDAAYQRLINIGFFAEVQPIQLLQGEGKNDGILLVRVREGKTSRLNGAVGYMPSTDQQDGYWTGLFMLSIQNLVGTGREVTVEWNRKDAYSSFAHFGYREPWVLGSPLAVGVDLQQTIQDSLYTKRHAQLILEIPITESLTGGLQFAAEEVIPGTQLDNPIIRSNKTLTGGSLTWDTRNSLYNPDRGTYYRLTANYGKRKYKPKDDQLSRENASEIILTSRVEQYFPTFRRQAAAVSLNGKIITSSEETIPIHEQFRLGGTLSLRGYKEDQFRGEYVGWSNVEYRFLLTRQSRFFLFLDTGFYYYQQLDEATDPAKVNEFDGFKVGYGLGLRVASRLGIIGIDYGLGEGDGFLDGKIHFGLEEIF